MATITIVENCTLGGVSFSGQTQATGDGQVGEEVAIAAAIAGVLSVRGGDDAGTINGLATGHGLLQNDLIDIYWSGGRHYNVTVDTANANDIVFNNSPAGAGDILPAQTTVVTVCKQVTVNTAWDGDDCKAVLMQLPSIGLAQFRDAGAASLAVIDLAANAVWRWLSGQGVANPLTGNAVATMRVTQAGMTAEIFKLGVLRDSTP